MHLDNIIKRLFWNTDKNTSNSNYRKFVQKKTKYNNILNYLLNRFDDSESTSESLQRIVFNIENRPVCPVCGSKLDFVGKPNTVKGTFKKFCSQHSANSFNSSKANLTKIDKYGDAGCSKKAKTTKLERYGNENYNGDREVAKSKMNYEEIFKKVRATNLERYGDEYYNGDREVVKSKMNYEEIFRKVRATNLERYGDEWYHGDRVAATEKINYDEVVKKVKETKKRLYGDENYNNIEKAKQTCLKKYGVEYTFNSKEIQDKIKQTILSKYGVEYALQSKEVQDKIKQTNLRKYGAEYPLQSEFIKNKIKQILLYNYNVDNPWKSKDIQNKLKQTWLKTLGVDNPFKSKNVHTKSRQTCLEKYGYEYATQAKEIQQKIHETKKKNGSYGKSNEEDYLYNVLVEIYGKDNVKRQYKSELYPFACDFYIITEDLYIEYNAMWTHGHTPYIGSKENAAKLEKWKQKAITSDYYKRAIITWTISDVKKRNMAKTNGLNYIELWDLNDVKKYFNL